MKTPDNAKPCKCGKLAVPVACDFTRPGKPDFIWQCRECGSIQDKEGYRE